MSTEKFKKQFIDAAKDYAGSSLGGVIVNNPEKYKAFRDGQDNAAKIISQHPQETKDNGIIEGLEDAGRDWAKLAPQATSRFVGFKRGAQWHHDTHYKPLLELCEGLKDVIELITTSPEWIKNYGGGAVDIKANAQIEKANKLLNK